MYSYIYSVTFVIKNISPYSVSKKVCSGIDTTLTLAVDLRLKSFSYITHFLTTKVSRFHFRKKKWNLENPHIIVWGQILCVYIFITTSKITWQHFKQAMLCMSVMNVIGIFCERVYLNIWQITFWFNIFSFMRFDVYILIDLQT